MLANSPVISTGETKKVFLRCIFLHLYPWFTNGVHLLGRMKISASLVEPFARETHSLLQHVRVRVKECYLHVAAILLCDSGRAVLPGGGSCRTGLRLVQCQECRKILPVPVAQRCSSAHEHQHPFRSTPLARPSPSWLAVFMLWLSKGAFSSQCRSMSSAPGHQSCCLRLFSPQFLQHMLQRAWLVGDNFLLSVFVFRKTFCNVDLNSYLRLKSLGLVISK